MDNSLLSSQGFSARRDPDNKVCYVSKLDPSLPSPKEMKQEMDQVSFVEKFGSIPNMISFWIAGFNCHAIQQIKSRILDTMDDWYSNNPGKI